ncbi:M16 family metallopeptidase [Lactobacillus hominis]|uniref:Zinc protease n=1 Tax=Lactobacillus hominis DSM 23910 = CRBIP 24.179 TaxID=1423758 RepID=I7L9V6_9LACO|nr:insulinase family protein [Lactobacillus hominis]KRM84448.1 zinc protease [Lactobacillus hominis DSM 23910 = CRBIP 24.179]MCT3347943.1 insulinase family protein [Lactobacillus hominis]CCI81714.1 Zinc protease [Lactobacillus hominis DSM 23910 = CRBIP 24.179]
MANIQIEHNLKFTTATFGCFLRMPLNKKNLALANLLATMQNMASTYYPGVSVQAKALEELYDMHLTVIPEVFGSQILMFYVTNFVEPREILDPDYNYRVIVRTYFEIVNNPILNEQLLHAAKERLTAEKSQFFDIPENYAYEQFFNYWYRKTPQWQESTFGDPDVLENCSVDNITAFFNNLSNCPTVCLGLAQDPDLLTDLIQPELNWAGCAMPFETQNLTIPAHYAPIDEVKMRNSEQTQLLLGYGYDYELPLKIRQFSGLVFGNYLAGDESSKLFVNIREKLGAAYAVDASNYLNNSLFLISTGIEKSKLDQVKAEIENQINKVAQNEVDEQLFKKAKQKTKKIYVVGQDSLDRQMLLLLSDALKGKNVSLQERIKMVDKVTLTDMVKFSQALFLNESYCLK